MHIMTSLTSFEPFEDFAPDFFRRFLPRTMPLLEPLQEIRIDVEDDDKQYVVRAEIPGAKKEDLRVEVDGNRVTIAADIRKDREATKDKGRMLVRETYEGSVSRSFSLPQDIDEAHVSAKLDNGVLQLALPKREGSRNRRIAVE
jgi:HSP20 family protein